MRVVDCNPRPRYNVVSPTLESDRGHQFMVERQSGDRLAIVAGCRVWDSFEQARAHFDLEKWRDRNGRRTVYSARDAKTACDDGIAALNWLETWCRGNNVGQSLWR